MFPGCSSKTSVDFRRTPSLVWDHWPTAIPSVAEAELIADVRRKMNDLMGLDMNYLSAESVLSRYGELIAASKANSKRQSRRG
jgi:hypothetical protein